MALLALGLIAAADEVDGSSVAVFMRRVPAAVLVLVIALLPISAQAVIIGLAVVTAIQAAIDVRASQLQGATPAAE